MALCHRHWGSTYNRHEMQCWNCGRKGLANKQSVRAHLRFCPNRYSDGSTNAHTGPQGKHGPEAGSRQLFVPYESIPLLNAPGVEGLEEPALAIGIPSRAARIAANYVGFNGDLNDALSMWDLLRDCYEIGTSKKRQLLRTWCSTRGVPLEDWQIDHMGWRDDTAAA